MLTSTFIHIPHIGQGTEKKIWSCGIKDWHSFDTSKLDFSESTKQHLKKYVDLSIEHFNNGNHQFFSKSLPKQEHWRALKNYSKIAYLDIETTGLSKNYHDITMIGVYDGHKARNFIKGKDLLEFKNYIKQFPMIVTFNGSCFDLPFIENKFKMNFDQLHVDLRFVFSKMGIRGGLKKIEREFGLERSDEIKGVDGFEAVRLWHRYIKGDDSALKTLIKYNSEDVIGLKILADKAYGMMKEKLTQDLS